MTALLLDFTLLVQHVGHALRLLRITLITLYAAWLTLIRVHEVFVAEGRGEEAAQAVGQHVDVDVVVDR